MVWGKETDGKYSIIESVIPANEEFDVPLHKKSKESGLIYVLEGHFQFKYDQKTIEGNLGTVLQIEKDKFFSYKKIGTQEGRLLTIYTPAGFENFFKDIEKLKDDSFKILSENEPILMHI